MPRLYFHEKLMALSLTVAVTLGGYWYIENRLGLDIEGYLARASSIIARNVTPPTPVGSLAEGLVGYWKLDEASWNGTTNEVVDSSGLENHGTANGGVTTISGGTLGRAGSFDGADDGIITPSQVHGPIVTLSAWVNIDDLDSSNSIIGACIDANSDCTGIDYDVVELLVTSSTGNVLAYLSDNYNVRRTESTSDTSISTGEWTMITGVVNSSSNTVEIYINSVFQPSTGNNVGSGDITVTGKVGIGARYSSFTDSLTQAFTDGSIDDVRIYDRALSAAEITELYQLGARTRISVTPPSIQTGLVGHWTFDGKDTNWGTNKTNDRTSNANHGTITNMSTSTAPTPGRLGQGLKFDGVDDYISLPVAVIPATDPWTVAAWIKRNPKMDIDVLGQYYDVFGSRTVLYVANGNEKANIQIGGSSVSSDSIIPTGVWTHVAWQRDASNNVTFYVNGVSDGGGSLAGSIDQQATDIGRFAEGGTSGYSGGSLDDVRIYNRVLTAAEITQLYNQGATTHVAVTPPSIQTGLVGHWTFDGKDVNWATGVVTDRAGGNNGSVVNMSTSSSPVAGRLGQGFKFDGGTGAVRNQSASSLSPGTGGWSESVWFRSHTRKRAFIVALTNGDASERAILELNANGKIEFSSDDGTDPVASIISSNSYDDGAWHHAVVTMDTNLDYEVFVDTVSVGTDTQTNSSVDTTELNIGNNQTGTLGFVGSIDDVRIYNRALSASEVKQLYEMGR